MTMSDYIMSLKTKSKNTIAYEQNFNRLGVGRYAVKTRNYKACKSFVSTKPDLLLTFKTELEEMY